MRITQRLILLFFFVILAFSVFIYVFFQIKQQEGQLMSKADELQRRQIINAFIDIKKSKMMQMLADTTAADAMFSFASQPHPGKAYNKLQNLILKYELDCLLVFDSQGKEIFQNASPRLPELKTQTFTPGFFKTIQKEKRKYFTAPWQQQFMQMGAATIHAVADTGMVQSPVGYIVIAKLWDSTYLEDFSQTLDYNVRIYLAEPKVQTDHPTFNVNIVIPLKGWDNKPVAWLRFRSSNPFITQLQSLGKHVFLGILLFTLSFLLLQFALLYQWINSPLRTISLSLKNGNPELIHYLSLRHNEFGEIARLVKRFFEQNQQLRTEMEERRKTEMLLRQAQKMESIGTLAGGIAHDFNNIITIISGYIALAAGKIVNDRDAQNNLDEAMRACQRAKSLIEKILTFSRQTDKTVIPVNLAKVVNETVELLRATIPPSIIIETDLASDAHVLADPTEIQQVVMNIATNSYHAMRYQGGKLSFHISYLSGHDVHNIIPAAENKVDFACLSIMDTGAGIPQEILERIFDPYFSTKSAGEGTGLGLSIVHGIVTSCGGYIHIGSILNGGTTVKVFLPVTFLRWEEIIDHHSELTFRPANIIFVDDEAALSELFRETLSDAGYTVTAFSDSTLALKMFESAPLHFDLLVADIAMPALNGINLSKKVLELRPGMPIILYTGFSDATIQSSCKELGIKRVLLKPILPEKLSEIVAQVLAEI